MVTETFTRTLVFRLFAIDQWGAEHAKWSKESARRRACVEKGTQSPHAADEARGGPREKATPHSAATGCLELPATLYFENENIFDTSIHMCCE